jgi:hypothetical protein
LLALLLKIQLLIKVIAIKWKQIVVFRNGHTRTIPLLFDLWLIIRKCCWDGEYSYTLFTNDRWTVRGSMIL